MTSKKTTQLGPNVGNKSIIALIIGIIGLAIAGYGLVQGLNEGNSRMVVSWLLGFSFWFSVAVGMLFLVMLWYLFDAGWSIIIRRQLEHCLAAFKWLALIFSPLVLIAWFYKENPGILWEWMNTDLMQSSGIPISEDALYKHKAGYLNVPFFTARVIFYFSVFCGLSWLLRRSSFNMDQDGDLKWAKKARVFAALGTPILALTVTFAAFDFFMSISYQWFSTMYGVWFFATSMRAALSVTVILCFFARRSYLKDIFKQAHCYDLGCIMLAFTVFWAYISFCQYFLIYSANIPEETFWYNIRELSALGTKTSWWWLSLFCLIFAYFVVPFLYLLFYMNKVRASRMRFIAIWILTFHLTDLYFNILPRKEAADNVVGFVVQQFSITVWDVSALVGVGGICIWAFFRSLQKTEIIPIRDPRILESVYPQEESIHHHKYD